MLAQNHFSDVNMLVIEDDVSGVALIGVLLRRLNINTHIDSTGQHATQIALSMNPKPDVILLDLNLPRGLTGFDVIKSIKAQPKLQHVPVIAVTAMDANDAIPLCKKLGFDGYIAKPLRRKQFIYQLERILAGKQVWESNWVASI